MFDFVTDADGSEFTLVEFPRFPNSTQKRPVTSATSFHGLLTPLMISV